MSLVPNSPRICLNSLRTLKTHSVVTMPVRRQSYQVGKCQTKPVGSRSSGKISVHLPCFKHHKLGAVSPRSFWVTVVVQVLTEERGTEK